MGDFDDVLNGLSDLPGIEVEMCGDWLWITGRTEKVKKELKALGCRWSEKKKAWFYTAEKRRWYKRGKTLGEIRMKYGRKVLIQNETEETNGKQKAYADNGLCRKRRRKRL